MTSISAFQNLLDAIDLPVWRRDRRGQADLGQPGLWREQSRPYRRMRPSARVTNSLTTVARERIRAIHDTGIALPRQDFYRRSRLTAPSSMSSTSNRRMVRAGIAIDVSKAEAVRAELARTLKSHAETLDHLATPVAIFDGDRRLQFYNQAFVQLWELDFAFLEKKPDN